MDSKTNVKTGLHGEELACRFLIKKGYEIKERNYRHKRAEIDIIAKKENLLLFVEVKTRSNNLFGDPEIFVDDKQADRIFVAADHYVFESKWEKAIRFDIISVSLKKDTCEIEHFQDAFF